VSVLFDDAYARGDVGPFGMASSAPTLIMPTFEVPTSPVGLPVVVKGISYTVAAHEPDGTGISRLLLELA
jgi:hypothetical protein